MCVLAFSRLIALYLLLLHALVLTNTCAELDKLMYVDNAGATLSMVVLGIRPLIHLYFRLFLILIFYISHTARTANTCAQNVHNA